MSLKPQAQLWNKWYIDFIELWTLSFVLGSKKYVIETSSTAMKQEWYIDLIEFWTLSFVSDLRSFSLKHQVQLWNKSGILILLSYEPYHLLQF